MPREGTVSEHESEEGDPRPWEQPGGFRRDCEPYEGYIAHTLAWSAFGCAVLGLLMPPLGLPGLVLGVVGHHWVRGELDQMHEGVLDPDGSDSACRAMDIAVTAVIVGALALVCWGVIFFSALD
jgi:hypothetical protein